MKQFTFITGNQHKADYLSKWLGLPVDHQKVELEELQSLDLREVVEHKVRQAYARVKAPVLVEDVSLTFTAMGRLPGTFIRWFLEEMGPEGLARMAAALPHQKAEAAIMYAWYDGNDPHTFLGAKKGTIAPEPRGENTFGKGWNGIFIPDGSTKTYAEMTEADFSHRTQAINLLRPFLKEQ